MRLRRPLMWLKVSGGVVTPPPASPTVSAVSSAGATEGGSIVHTVTLSSTPTGAITFSLSLSGGTASSGDYTGALTSGAFSNGVTISAGTITVPSGVSSFTVTVPTTNDSEAEATETYSLIVGGVSGTGTITDNDTPVGAGGAWQDNVNAPSGSASFTANWGSPGAGATAQVLFFGPTQIADASDYTAFPYRFYIANGTARSQTISSIAAGSYYWRIAPVENGTLGDLSMDLLATAV